MSKIIVFEIARKEVLEFVRDWRTILAIIIIPLLLFPVLFIAFPILLESEANELESLQVDIIWQGDYDPELHSHLNNSSITITFSQLPENITNLSTPGDDLDNVRSQQYDAILRLENNSTNWKFAILYLSTSEASNEAKNRILDSVTIWESEVVNGTL